MSQTKEIKRTMESERSFQIVQHVNENLAYVSLISYEPYGLK